MPFDVSVARRADPLVKGLRGKPKDGFWAAIERLEHEGCRAAHYRMRAPDGTDAHICGLRFYGDWRMHLVFGEDDAIVVSWVGRHTETENVHVEGAEDIPQLADIGRRREDQPPCCEDPEDPPVDQDLVDLVNQLRPR